MSEQIQIYQDPNGQMQIDVQFETETGKPKGFTTSCPQLELLY